MLRYFLFLIFFLAGATTLAAPLSAERAGALRAEFQTRQRETLTWSATIAQTLTLSGVRDPVVSTGTLAYRAPEQLRLDYTKPAGEFVLVLGDRLFIQKTGARLAEKSLREDSAGKPFLSLLGLLRGQPAEEESDYTAEVTREEDRYTVVLTRNADASTHMP
ncbi:MAG: outer membrane lipoprotein carrier protein LolA, partial [Pseudomonadota bacterium]|nr:outer membrane lipoprotein carrier protein LolA [Pseudomonadota bacterium]